MLRISLVNDNDKPFALELAATELMVRYTIAAAPNNFTELFNFIGVLGEDKEAHMTVMALESFLDRSKLCKPYYNDPQAPTMGNVRLVVERLLGFARQFPNGTWKLEQS